MNDDKIKTAREEMLKLGDAFAEKWTQKGLPTDPQTMAARASAGQIAGQLLMTGVSKKVIKEFLAETVDHIENANEKLRRIMAS